MTKHFSLLVTVMLATLTAFSQPQSFLSEKSLSIENDFSVEVYNTESGLPQNSIITMHQSSDGYLWFSTFSGMVRFDGMKFKLFGQNETKGLLSNSVVSIQEDKKKQLWFLDDVGHLVKYDGATFTGFEKSFNNININSFCFSDDGSLFVSTSNNEIYTVNVNVLDFITRINQTSIRSIYPGKNNSILIATTNGLFELKNNKVVKNEIAPNVAITGLSYDQDNFLWVSSPKGLFKVNENRAEEVQLSDDNDHFLKVFVDRQNRKWVYKGSEGLYMSESSDFTQMSEESGLSSNNINYIYQDREDNIWVGTNNAGLNKLQYKAFKTISVEDGLIADGVAPIIKTSAGIIYAGNNCGGINKIIEGKIIKLLIPKENTCVWSLLEDKNNNLWVGTFGGGLFKFHNDNEIQHYNKFNGLADDVVLSLFQDSRGKIWIGTDKGIFTYRNDSLIAFKRDIIKTKVCYFTEDVSKNIWAASNNGLIKISGHNATIYTTYDGLPTNTIRSLYWDDNNALWIGTVGGGFCRYKDSKFTILKNIPEISASDVFCIAEDDQQDFWFTTNKGIYSIKEYDLNNYADSKTATVSFRFYDRKDGLKTNEFNTGFQPNFLKEDDTHFMFPTIKGIAMLNTRRIGYSDYAPKVIIEKITADNHTFEANNNLVLQRSFHSLEISYTAPSFVNPQKIYFQYKLEGHDADWSAPTTDRTVKYFNIKPGNYNFKLKIYGIYGSDRNLLISVPLPTYRSNWFLALVYVAALGLLGLITYLRIKYIRKQEKNKTEINKKLAEFELKALQAQMNPHFLFNCLNTIKYFITTNNPAAANKYLTKFSKLLRMFLDHSTTNTVTLEEEINLLRLYIELEQMRFDEGFNFHLKVDEAIDYKNTEIPSTLFQPFVENAINHGLLNLNRKGNLTLIFEQVNDTIRGIVDDDGVGRGKSEKLKQKMAVTHISRGTQLIDDRIKTLNYIRPQSIEIEIIDKIDEHNNPAGTRVIVTIPVIK
ncbi:MAG: histidine kinase [Bacteroidetes bacterium]|nr:histidine kinase [Bacteroidota bacterium]